MVGLEFPTCVIHWLSVKRKSFIKKKYPRRVGSKCGLLNSRTFDLLSSLLCLWDCAASSVDCHSKEYLSKIPNSCHHSPSRHFVLRETPSLTVLIFRLSLDQCFFTWNPVNIEMKSHGHFECERISGTVQVLLKSGILFVEPAPLGGIRGHYA